MCLVKKKMREKKGEEKEKKRCNGQNMTTFKMATRALHLPTLCGTS